MSQSNRLMLTQSLIGSWLYQFNAYDSQEAQKEFLRVLCKEPVEETEAMHKGNEFEALVYACCEGADVDHAWAPCAKQAASLVRGGQFQATARKNMTASGVDLLLYGRLDALKAGVVYDIKFSEKYVAGKYINSPQHPMYLELIPEARKFVYVVSDGADLFLETYTRAEVEPIESIVRQFLGDLRAAGQMDLYRQHWTAK